MGMFCPKCGGLIVPKKVKGKTVLTSASCTEVKRAGQVCKHLEQDDAKGVMVETVEAKDDIAIVDSKDDDSTLPEIDAQCPKCGNDRGKYWVVQTRASDEAPTKFIKCSRCSHTWRDYS